MTEISLDSYDAKIIEVLRSDARIPVSQLAERVGLSKTPCAARMRRLQENGVIKGFTAMIDYSLVGKSHIAFVEVTLKDTSEPALQEFNAAVKGVSEVEQCHMIAGSFDYLLKVRTSDIASYRRVLGETISTLPLVSNTSTFVAMETVIDGSP